MINFVFDIYAIPLLTKFSLDPLDHLVSHTTPYQIFLRSFGLFGKGMTDDLQSSV